MKSSSGEAGEADWCRRRSFTHLSETLEEVDVKETVSTIKRRHRNENTVAAGHLQDVSGCQLFTGVLSVFYYFYVCVSFSECLCELFQAFYVFHILMLFEVCLF